MKRIFKILFVLCLVVPSVSLHAQESDLGNWFVYFGNYRVADRWSIWLEGQHRNYNFVGDLEQAFVRTAALYDLPKANSQLGLGYGFFHTASYKAGTDEKSYTDEHRIYQQFITRQRFGRLYLTHRYRLEERFLKAGFRTRFRYSLGANLCLNKPEMTAGTLYFSAYNELFINTESPIFDRDRLYCGLGYSLGPKLRLETGLMYQLFENRKRPQWQIVCFHNMDLRHKSDN